jgi:formylglycine-generating enzyme required for sulfatase activity
MLQVIRADLEKTDKRHRKFIRYFTLSHLYNAGLSDDELQTYRHALSKLVNSLSWDRRIVVPAAIDDPARTIFRIDVRDFKWIEPVWNLILEAYPYGIEYDSDAADYCRQMSQCRLPYVRADWFVFAASRPPLYHEVLQLPKSAEELEAKLWVDVAENLRPGRVACAGINNSGVARNNRLFRRFDSILGYLYESFDFASNVGRRNIFDHPLGPGDAQNEFQHDGGEIIFSLPNGLQGYMLVDNRGSRIDIGPTKIVVDKNQGDAAVVNGISCMSCHVKGIIEKSDEIREHVRKNSGAFSKDETEAIRALYVPREEFALKMKEDAERFAAAVRKTGAHLSATEPIVALEKRYLSLLDLNQAAAEAGMKPEDYREALKRSKKLSRSFGETVQRKLWEEKFGELVRELELGKFDAPPRSKEITESPQVVVRNSIGMELVPIPTGRFRMGSPKEEEGRNVDEEQHDVQITRPFYAGVCPVTQAQFEQVMGVNPSFFARTGEGRDKVQGIDTGNFPVEQVSWEDAEEFCRKLSNRREEKKEGRVYRLPTEARWEYMCRGEAKESTPFNCGPTLTRKDANIGSDKTTAVGLYKPNRFGLHDMHGNVLQWCHDYYDPEYYSKGPVFNYDPQGPTERPAGAEFRVLRGGSWQYDSKDCRSACRHKSLPHLRRGKDFGFRVVMEIVEKKP